MATKVPRSLTLEEQSAILELHQLLAATFTDASSHTEKTKSLANNATPDQLRKSFYSADKLEHPDDFALRWLRFTGNVPSRAHNAIVKSLKWRLFDVHIDDEILPLGAPGNLRIERDPNSTAAEKAEAEGFLKQLRTGKSLIRGADKEGHPIVVIKVKIHKGGDQTTSSMDKFVLWQIEHGILGLPDGVVGSMIIFDLTGFGLANMDYKLIQFIIETFTRHYPLQLAAVIIYNSPWLFSACWKLIKGWIPADFQERVHFCGKTAELEKLVAKDQIVTDLGGDLPSEYTFEDPTPQAPETEEQKAKKDELWAARLKIADALDANVKEWAEGVKEGRDVADARAKRESLAAELATNYWLLDPLVRAPGIYDEWGLIKNPLK